MARKPVRIPDYFTTEEAQALVAAAPSYPVKMAMRVMLRTGLRVSECLSLRSADLRFNQDPPIISLRPEVTDNKAKRGREIPIPADLASSLSPNPPIEGVSRQGGYARRCSCASGIMVFETQTDPKTGAPIRCYHL